MSTTLTPPPQPPPPLLVSLPRKHGYDFLSEVTINDNQLFLEFYLDLISTSSDAHRLTHRHKFEYNHHSNLIPCV